MKWSYIHTQKLKGQQIKIGTYIGHRHTQLSVDGFLRWEMYCEASATRKFTDIDTYRWTDPKCISCMKIALMFVKRIKGTKIYMDKYYSTFYLSWISINKGSSWWLSLWNNVFRSASTQEIIPTHFLMNIPQIHILQQNEPWYLST